MDYNNPKEAFGEEVPFEDRWSEMRPLVVKVLHQQSISRTEWHTKFGLVFCTCIWDPSVASKLYTHIEEEILVYTKGAQTRVLNHSEDQALLKAYTTEWNKYFAQCNYLPQPFQCLVLFGDSLTCRTTTKICQTIKKQEGDVVLKLMLKLWYESIFSRVKTRIQEGAMKLIQEERNGLAFDSQLVIGVRESYVNLVSDTDDKLLIYREHFERSYIEGIKSFYLAQAPEYLRANGVLNYLRYADQKSKEEKERARKYLHDYPGSDQILEECCVNVLLTSFREIILAECSPLAKCNDVQNLQLMFKLMDRVTDGGNQMSTIVEEYMRNTCLTELLADAAANIIHDPEKYVGKLLQLFERFTTLVDEAFFNDSRFFTARDKAFKHIVNDTTVFKLELPSLRRGLGGKVQPESMCPQLLAIYCDQLMRITPVSKKLTSDQIERRLKDVLQIMKYVGNKDVFIGHYKSHLTRRLILGTSADYEKEEFLIHGLRDIGMPADCVNQLSKMFQDIKLSEDMNQQFKDQHSNDCGSHLADSINIKILHSGAWSRGNERVTATLPMELEDYIPALEDFYRKKHNGRKLQWHHQFANGILKFNSRVGNFELEVTTFQMAILFAWNERPDAKITYENLRLATELPDIELRKTLWSLVAFPKLKSQVVLYSGNAKSPYEFENSTLFQVNHDFQLLKNGKPQKRGKLSLIGRLQLSTEKNVVEDNEEIVQLRIMRTQEAIVKIMKMRKTIGMAELQMELIEILKNMFLPSKMMIKHQIEWLIDNKYMKRDEDNNNTFIYVA